MEEEDGRKKIIKILVIVVIITFLITGIIYAGMHAYAKRTKIEPTFVKNESLVDTNKVWVGTFQLVWNDFMDQIIKEPIEFEDGESELATQLNEQSFKIEQLSENSYYKISGRATKSLKNTIESDIKEKFNTSSRFLDKLNWEDTDGYILYAILNKKFNYIVPFDELENTAFQNKKVKFFGIQGYTKDDGIASIEVLYYNNETDFAIKLKTKEKEEVYLYRNDAEDSFQRIYNQMIKKQRIYGNGTEFTEHDTLAVPFIKLSEEINYDELCGRKLKNNNGHIKQAIQTINFELNNMGGSVQSEATIDHVQGALYGGREFNFTDTFYLFLKEQDKQQPYFALKVDNTDILVPENE